MWRPDTGIPDTHWWHEMAIKGLSIQTWIWCLWHTRPGHRPAGIAYTAHRAYCTACGSEAPK